jgi:hypothetical protein
VLGFSCCCVFHVAVAALGVGVLVFEYSSRDLFECQNVVEVCWFQVFFTQTREVFE